MEKIRNFTQHNLPLKTKTNNINVQGEGWRQDLRTPLTDLGGDFRIAPQ